MTEKPKVDFKAYQAKLAFEEAWLLPIGGSVGDLTIEQKVEETKFTGRTIWLSNKEAIEDPMWKPLG